MSDDANRPKYIKITKDSMQYNVLRVVGPILGTLLVVFVLHYFKFITLPQYSNTKDPNTIRTSSLYTSQNATTQGTISSTQNNSITVKDQSGQVDTFPVSEKLTVYKYDAPATDPKVTSDIGSIELGRKAIIFLSVVGGQYQVTSITYTPPQP